MPHIDTVELVMMMAKADMKKKASERGHMTLGALIDALGIVPKDTIVKFNTGGSPGKPDSYRGYYEQLAFETVTEPQTADQVRTRAERALTETYHGYKGGEYKMNRGTWIWNAPYGVTGDAIVGVSLRQGVLILKTEKVEFN